MGPLMTKAWELFDKAVSFESKAQDTTKSESLRNTALRAADRKLNEACVAEDVALAAGERHA